MMQHYEMTDLGLLYHFLGMGVVQTDKHIFLHHKKYALKVIEKFGLKDCKSMVTPLVANERLYKEDGREAANESEYRQIVGSLLYLIATRPDIMFASSWLDRFIHNPTRKHMGTAKRVLRYIQGTLDFGTEFIKGKTATLLGYCDSDWAGSEDDRRSTSGYAFTLGSGMFSWASIRQNTVALSNAEAEYVSAAEATSQAKWLRFVLEDFGEEQDKRAKTILLQGLSHNGIYPIPCTLPSQSKSMAFRGQKASSSLWHRRLGHPTNAVFKLTLKNS
ncbi:hypothetical protein L3X38_012024 [Prunus dulcis]|uniref:Transposable element protein n=1 Tax=Prunus dulcis TaxID=3755 RepID=A0AAD4WLB0_PRUDU|nr:hypothetical protein L3X38_012024 [Prunus dulcis]